MNGPATGAAVFVCLFSSALAGCFAHARLNSATLGSQASAVLRRGIWIVAVMAGIMLALMTVSLKNSFDSAAQNVSRFSSQIVSFDRQLRRIGPEAEPARALLFRYAARTLKDVWPETQPRLGPDDTHADRLFNDLEATVSRLQAPAPGDVPAALQSLREISQARWLLDTRDNAVVSPWLLGILVFWLMLTFASLGLSAPRTPGLLGILALGAVALSGAVFLVVEYADPFTGVIILSSDPVQTALFALSE